MSSNGQKCVDKYFMAVCERLDAAVLRLLTEAGANTNIQARGHRGARDQEAPLHAAARRLLQPEDPQRHAAYGHAPETLLNLQKRLWKPCAKI